MPSMNIVHDVQVEKNLMGTMADKYATMIFDPLSPTSRAVFSRGYFFRRNPSIALPSLQRGVMVHYTASASRFDVLLITIDGLSTFRR